MTYDINAHRQRIRDDCLTLAKAGTAWHAYALAKAEALQEDDPTVNVGLVAAVEAELGPRATAAARREIARLKK